MKSNNKEQSSVKPTGIGLSMVFLGATTAAMWFAMQYFLPWMVVQFATTPAPIAWYISTGIAVFLPLLLLTMVLVKTELKSFTYHQLKHRLRIRKLKGEDWIWVFLSIMLSAILTMVFIFISKNNIDHFSPQPALLQLHSLAPEDSWIMLACLPLFLFNLLSEELFWRGYLFPRQQAKFGKRTWLINGLLWLIFRLPLGLNFLIASAPTAFLITYAFQKTQNIKVAILVNGVISGLGVIALALGYM